MGSEMCIRDSWPMAPGIVFGDVVSMYAPNSTTPHLMWCHPFTTPQLDRVEIGDLKVHWLLGVPITEAERQWLEVNGFDDFVDLLDAKAVNYTDLQRPSAV